MQRVSPGEEESSPLVNRVGWRLQKGLHKIQICLCLLLRCYRQRSTHEVYLVPLAIRLHHQRHRDRLQPELPKEGVPRKPTCLHPRRFHNGKWTVLGYLLCPCHSCV